MKSFISWLFIAVVSLQGLAVDITGLKLTATSESSKKSAEFLAGKLRKIYGKEFQITDGNGKSGIAVGTPADFPELAIKLEHPQEILVKTHAEGIYVIGATARAVDYAVGKLLYQIGYRYYFPMGKWEIYPEKPQSELSLDISEKPDYLTRSIWPGWGIWPDFRKSTNFDAEWKKINGLGGIDLKTGHAYGRFIAQNRKEFDAHPEYFALYKGERKSTKLCISNPGLRKLICDYALESFRKAPETESFSMDPSDGGGWCECEPCVKLGTPSDRAVTLANAVAEAVNAEFSGKLIGMYAYNMHSPPPSIRVHPQVVVCIATSFILGGWSVDKLIEGWRRQGASIGIREYYTAGLPPGRGKATNLDYLAGSIPDFRDKGARFMIAESSDSWGPGGLGYYLAAQLLWNVKADPEQIKADFFRNAFPQSEAEMRQFYQLIDGSKRRPLNADLLGRMYRSLAKARPLAVGEMERSRVDALVYYTRIAELQFLYETSETVENYEQLYSFIASVREERLVHSYAMSRDSRIMVRSQLKGKNLPSIKWTATPPPDAGDAEKFIREGVEKYQLLDFTPVEYSSDLRLVTLPGENQTGDLGTTRGQRRFYIWSDGSPVTLQVTGGLIKHYRNRGNVRMQLIQIGGPSADGTLETLIQEDASVPPDGEKHSVTLTPKYPGLHWVTIDDGKDRSRIEWPVNLPAAMPVEQENVLEFNGTFYFYVPKGCRTLGFYAKTSRGGIFAPDGKLMKDLRKSNGFYSFEIPEKYTGKVWSIRNAAGVIRLLTVPSELSLNSKYLLLPNEIVKDIK